MKLLHLVRPMDIGLWPSVFAHLKKQMIRTGGFTFRQKNRIPILKESVIIQSCDDLPYKIFKKCCVHKAYDLLGQGSPEQLEEAYIKLYSEFLIISEDETAQTFIQEWADYTLLESRIFRVSIFTDMLMMGYNPLAIKILRDLGYKYPFTKAGYLYDVQRVEKKLNNDRAKMTMLLNGIKRKQEKDNKELTASIFDDKINQIERIFKCPINVDTLSTQMYALKIRDLKNYIADLESKKQKHV